MIVHWTETAIKHLTAIYQYIALDSSIYAQRMADKLIRRSEQIGIFPRSGRQVPEYEAQTRVKSLNRPTASFIASRPIKSTSWL